MPRPTFEESLTIDPPREIVEYAKLQAFKDGRPGDWEDYLVECLILDIDWKTEGEARPEDFLRCSA